MDERAAVQLEVDPPLGLVVGRAVADPVLVAPDAPISAAIAGSKTKAFQEKRPPGTSAAATRRMTSTRAS